MNVLLDLGAIKTGGGVQLALNFVRQINARRRPGDRVWLLVSQGSLLEREAASVEAAGVWASPRSYLRRAAFEYLRLPRLLAAHGVDVVFTFFGAGVPRPRGIRAVVTVAYPIICYPESAYWRFERPGRRWFNRVRNWLRCRRLRRAERLLAETEVMRARLARTLAIDPARIHLLPPAVSAFAEPRPRTARDGPFVFVTVSDNSHHKNIWRLYAVARALRESGLLDFRFVMTVREADFRADIPERDVDETILATHFRCLGPVAPTSIMDVYGSADAMVIISDLESFSNNYIEAWRVGLPIVASDRDFARHICGDSAVYVEPHDPAGAAAEFARVARDAGLRERLVAAGAARLRAMPTLEQRCDIIWREIDSVAAAP
jgi:glycosyltransferase involved in cell wall biosynthesis